MGGDAAGSVIVATPGSDLDRSKFVIRDPVIDVSIASDPCFHIMRGGNLTILSRVHAYRTRRSVGL